MSNKNDAPDVNYNRQCLTCNLDSGELLAVHAAHLSGNSYNYISSLVNSQYGKKISPDALSNHMKKHAVFAKDFLVKADSHTSHVEPEVEKITKSVAAPKGWAPSILIDGDSGEVTTVPQERTNITDFTTILEDMGVDPEEFSIVGSPRVSRWMRYDGQWLTAYKLQLERKNGKEEIDLPALFAEVRLTPQKKFDNTKKAIGRAIVVPFADLQAGKVGSRGDSKSLIERANEKLEKLRQYISDNPADLAVFMDGGDVVESFENTAQQGFTNDLSIMEQIDLASTIEQKFITLLAETHHEVIVTGVPSNHSAWRKGKDVLGRPSDDWGIFILKQIEKAFKLNPEAYGHVRFVYPDEWKKSVNIDVLGTGIGLVHGDDVTSMDAIPKWWASQVHGASPIAISDVLVTNHYHTMRLQPSGRSILTGRQKYWVATSTLDNGSDWFANKAGSDSDPGLTVFMVDENTGFDLGSPTIL